jgi:hypothetical protein
VYEICHGKIPRGHVVRHLCDNRTCCNPSHLATGTHRDNMRDVANSGTQRGENNGNAKLTAEMVCEIRRRRRDGELLKILAYDYGVHYSTVRAAATRGWPHVDEPPVKPRGVAGSR